MVPSITFVYVIALTLFATITLTECLDQIVVIGGSIGNIRLIQSQECDCLQDVVSLFPEIVTTVVFEVEVLCRQQQTVNIINSSHFRPHTDIWLYSVNNSRQWNGSNSDDVVAVSLNRVLRRPRVVLYTSFLMQFSLDTEKDPSMISGFTSQAAEISEYSPRDALFVLREGESLEEVVHQFLMRHVPQDFMDAAIAGLVEDEGNADASDNKSYNEVNNFRLSETYLAIHAHIQERVILETPLRAALRLRAFQMLSMYRHLCPAGVSIGIGEKKFGVVDRYNTLVKSGMCAEVGVEMFDYFHHNDSEMGSSKAAFQQSCCDHWVLLDLNVLDVTDAEDFHALLGEEGSVARIRAEHVWEHLSLAEAIVALNNCYKYLKDGGTLRLAVPDINWDLRLSEFTYRGNESGCQCLRTWPSTFDRTLATIANCTNYNVSEGDITSRVMHPELFARDIRALHCVQYTLSHILGLVRSVFSRVAVVEYTDDCGWFHSYSSLYTDSDWDGNIVHVLKYGFIQRSSFGDQGQRARSIIVDMYK